MGAFMLGLRLKKWIHVLALLCFGGCSNLAAEPVQNSQQPKPQEGWRPGDAKWPDWVEEAARRLEKTRISSPPGPDLEFLQSRASDLLDRAKASRDNYFRFGRFIAAANSMLEANDRIVWSRKIDRAPQEQDYWGAGLFLPGCYFRVRQAEFFASMIGEKNMDQYVIWSKSLYQQARGALDAREYQRARLLGDASSFIVFALESIAQATVQMPDTPIIK
jgi:hypothetical protein